MFFETIIHRRLSSLLQPWLRDEPELELKLGLVNSVAIAKNLSLNTRALNHLISDDSSLYFKEVNVEHLTLGFSNWSARAFTLHVRGVHVELSVREMAGSSRQDKKTSNADMEDVRKRLSLIDPEGSSLNDVLERILATSSSRNKIATSFLNLVLNHCCLQMLSINVQLQFPVSGASIVYISEMKELNAESAYRQQGSFIRGMVGALIRPLKESSFIINGSGFEIGYKRDDHMKRVCSSNEMFSFVKLHELQLVDFHLQTPELSFLFSPVDLSVFELLNKLSSKESTHARSGRLLWKLASRRIGSVISAPRLSLHNLVALLSLWMRYVSTYENLLSLLGYSAEYLFKRSAVKMSKDKVFLNSAKSNWELICDIEKELPPEAVAKARRIARYKAALHVQRAEEKYKAVSLVNCQSKIFCKIIPVVACIWKVLCRVIHLIVNVLIFWKNFSQKPESDGNVGVVSDYSYPHFRLILNLGKILVNVYPVNSTELVHERLHSHTGISYFDFLSFCLSVDELLLMHTEEISEKCMNISCGKLKVTSSTFVRASSMKSSQQNLIASPKGARKQEVDNISSILWSEPAQMFTLSGNNETDPIDEVEGARDLDLENVIKEMSLNWKRSCRKFEESEIEYSESPWILCEIKSFLTYPEFENPDSGFWKCSLTVGKLNLTLGYLALLSLTLLFQQLTHAINWNSDSKRTSISGSPQPVKSQPDVLWVDKYENFASRMKMYLLRVLPEKHIQSAVLIAGPCIQISLAKVGLSGGNGDMNVGGRDDFHVEFDFHKIEFFVCPTSKSDLVSFSECLRSNDAEPQCIRLQEPRIIDIPKLNNEKFSSHGWISLRAYFKANGLSTYFWESVERQPNQIFALKPITVRASSFREYVHNLTTSLNALSTAFCTMATGFTSITFMDELNVFVQVVTSSFSVLSYVLHSSKSAAYVPFKELLKQDMVFNEHENMETNIKGSSFMFISTLMSLSGIFTLKSIDIIIHNSRMRNKTGSLGNFNSSGGQKLADDFSDCGFWISVDQTCIDTSCEEGNMEVLINLSGIKSLVVRYEDDKGKSFDQYAYINLLQQLHNCLYELSLSNCIFTLWFGCPQNSSASYISTDPVNYYSSAGNMSKSVESFPLITESEKSIVWPRARLQNLVFASDIFTLVPSHWILVNVAVDEILLARCSVKNSLVAAHQFSKVRSSLSVGGEFQKVSWGTQGGLILLEVRALEMFVRYFSSYVDRFSDMISTVQSSTNHFENATQDEDRTEPNNDLIEDSAQRTHITSQEAERALLETFTINVAQCSLVFVFEEEFGGARELVLEVDAHMKFGLANMQQLIIDFSRLSIVSQVLESVKNEYNVPHFSSVPLNEASHHYVDGEGTVAVQYNDGDTPFDGASTSKGPISHNNISSNNFASNILCLGRQNFILEHLRAFVSVEKVENIWAGSGSISGCEMTISLSELQMILSAVSSFSGVPNKEMASEMTKRHWSINLNQETASSSDDVVPDGAIVAIQDVHQHTYFTVEDQEDKYTLAGAVHYSLVGERALFRVKHHKQRRWMSSVLWFSLISLYAQNESGLSLRLNYHQGSYLVDISGTDDSSWALWRTIPCELESYNNMDWEPRSELVKGTFFLVNKKNDCAVAFVDEVPEFVHKPGNPFKFKVFEHLSLTSNIVTSDRVALGGSRTNLSSSEHEDARQTSGIDLRGVHIAIDKVSLTIVHELLNTKNRFPLLCGCIGSTQLTVQILTKKVRVISTSRAFLTYFDAQKSLWRELIRPVDVRVYYRSTSPFLGSETVIQRVPVHIYCRTTTLEICLTELSVDILLFAIGKLNLAGPYSIRSSRILANCCKVENQSGLTLECHFNNQQSVTLGKNKSTSIFLSPSSTSVNQPPDIASVVSFQLSAFGSFTTSAIGLSLLESKSLAWRTRILSAQGSKTYPGPFIVVDISRKSEDGLSIVVSPLVRIHNGTEFSMELRFWRPEENEDKFASVLLRPGDAVDDSMAMFDAINSSGGLKKALMSLSVGNFLFSFRPESQDSSLQLKSSLSVEWSEELKGGKAVRLSGIFDKLSYEVRKALLFGPEKCSFSTTHCKLKSEGACVGSMHFLIQTIGREVPIMEPDNSGDGLKRRSVPIALQEQKEIILLPTVRVSNLLHLEIDMLLTENDPSTANGCESIGKQARILCGSTMDFYVNPAVMFFSVTLTAFKSSCKPVNTSDWVKKLLKHKSDMRSLDIDLDFGAGKYFASLRLSRGRRGLLEAAVFTAYTLRNETDDSLFFYAPDQKPLSRDEVGKFHSTIPPELGLLLPPKSTGSWFSKSHKARLKLLEDNASQALLDLDIISGLTEIKLQAEEGSGLNFIRRFGVSVGPSLNAMVASSQLINIVPRYVIVNESEGSIIVRQCDLEDDKAHSVHINSKQRTALKLRDGVKKKREFSVFETFIRKHGNDTDNSSIFIQFQLDEPEWGWSGPLCLYSLGRFFLKFRKGVNQVTDIGTNEMQFAAVCVAEEGSTLVVQFYRPPNVSLPYRIENRLRGASITFYQKDSSESEVLGPGCSVDYAWDDLTLPHILVVMINGIHSLREINLDKVRSWKPFSKLKQQRRFAPQVLLDKISGDQRNKLGEFNGMEVIKMGYEVSAEGPTRVLQICEYSDSCKGDTVSQFCAKIQLRMSLAVNLLEHRQQDLDASDASLYTPILVARLKDINLDSVFTDRQKYNHICLQSLDVEEKWLGAPFSAMLRRHQLIDSDSNDCVLRIVFVLLSTSSTVKQVKHSSIVLQPIDLNLDEETLMRVVSFWRTSLSDSKTQSRQYYFDHFEIHPMKIIATFLPGDSYSSYNSAQETLRSLLHSVVKVPSIKNMVVELNGILVTHVLITMRELLTKCGQHYFWYVMRSIYIAKGSPLLPPAFASIFDDMASSSLDVFFDPSKGLMNLPGVTLGTFKFISKCIDGKGFSGTKRYFGDLHKTLRTAGSNVLFAAVTEISDSVLKGAERSGFDGLVSGFHQGILKLAMEPSVLGTALMGGGPDRKIKLDRSPGIDELYIEGYLQAMLDAMYRQEYLRVRVVDDEVLLKNLPPNNALIEEIMDRVKEFLASKGLLKGDPSAVSRPLRHLRGESEWRIGPTVLTLFEHLFVSYAIRLLRKEADKLISGMKWKKDASAKSDDLKAVSPSLPPQGKNYLNLGSIWKWGIGKFVLSGIAAYIDGRLCRNIPNPVARRIVGGFLLSYLDRNDSK